MNILGRLNPFRSVLSGLLEGLAGEQGIGRLTEPPVVTPSRAPVPGFAMRLPDPAPVPTPQPRTGKFSRVESDDLPGDARALGQGTTGGPKAMQVPSVFSGPVTPEMRRAAIKSIESGGRYDAVGPRHPKLGRALGAYQVMEANLPTWTKAAIGREVDAETFLRSPQIQDAVFDRVFGGYAERFGESGAAEAWFAGPGGVGKNRSDVLGTSTGKYAAMYNNALGRGAGSEATSDDTRRQAIDSNRVARGWEFPTMPGGVGSDFAATREPPPTSDPRSARADPARGARIDVAQATAETTPETQRPSTPVAQAVEQWKVNKTTRRMRGLDVGATIGALTAIGQLDREEREAALRGQPRIGGGIR